MPGAQLLIAMVRQSGMNGVLTQPVRTHLGLIGLSQQGKTSADAHANRPTGQLDPGTDVGC